MCPYAGTVQEHGSTLYQCLVEEGEKSKKQRRTKRQICDKMFQVELHQSLISTSRLLEGHTVTGAREFSTYYVKTLGL